LLYDDDDDDEDDAILMGKNLTIMKTNFKKIPVLDARS
jgi:hypothetical protein